jgi:hypothetical protein
MAASLVTRQSEGSRNSDSRGIATVRSRYQATTTEDTAGWKRPGVCASDLLNVWKLAMAL